MNFKTFIVGITATATLATISLVGINKAFGASPMPSDSMASVRCENTHQSPLPCTITVLYRAGAISESFIQDATRQVYKGAAAKATRLADGRWESRFMDHGVTRTIIFSVEYK